MRLMFAPQEKDSRFPAAVFWVILGALMLTTGIHMGLLVLFWRLHVSNMLMVHLTLLYWFGVAVLLTLLLRRQFRKTYDAPTREISNAMQKIAAGDFSVRIAPFHTEDKMDYLDYTVLDLNKMAEELGSIETLRSDFISNVSHEIKTPLSVIKNYAELLQRSAPTEETFRDYTATIVDAADKMSALVSDVLKLNRLEQETLAPAPLTFDLCRRLCDCVIGLEDQWGAKGLEINMEIEDHVEIRSEPELLDLVWNNLLSNAIKFNPVGGSITVREHSTATDITVTVADTGCGMTPDTVKHIFEKFYQGDTSHATEGNGLGLALVSRVLTLLHGSIAVNSTPGSGSTFTVQLPRVLPAAPEAKRS